MTRLRAWLLPIVLAVAGVAFIIAGGFAGPGGGPTTTLPPIPAPSGSPVAATSPTATAASSPDGSPGATETPAPSAIETPAPTPVPEDWVAVQLEVPSVGVNVAVRATDDAQICDFPPDDAAYIICGGEQPGRGTNAYLFAHAVNYLFKPLWNVQLGAEVRVLMSDGAVLSYLVTEVRPNVPCPDPQADAHPNPPLALVYSPENCSEGAAWTAPTPYERLTLQTSQGYNRNWGELVIVAEPLP